MTLVLELPERKEAALKAKAQAQGVSAEQYAQHVLDRDLEDSVPAAPRDGRPIWEVITEIMKDVPDEVFDRLPKDGASQIDHYLWPSQEKLVNLLIRHRLRKDAAKSRPRILTAGNVRVLPQNRDSFLEGLDLYEAHPDKGYSLADCISMQTMRREGLPPAMCPR